MQQLMTGLEDATQPASSALRETATNVLPYVALYLPATDTSMATFITTFNDVMSMGLHRLPDQLLMCACLGMLENTAESTSADLAPVKIRNKLKAEGVHGAIYTLLQRATQVSLVGMSNQCCCNVHKSHTTASASDCLPVNEVRWVTLAMQAAQGYIRSAASVCQLYLPALPLH